MIAFHVERQPVGHWWRVVDNTGLSWTRDVHSNRRMPGAATVTREEFRLEYREARKVHGFIQAFGRRLPGWPVW